MARLVTKFKYLPPDEGNHRGRYATYIATRRGVDKIDDSKKHAPATKRQKELIQNILKDFPDASEMLEYEDFQQNPSIGNASEFITRALEDNISEVLDRDGYARYIATRPRAERFGSHGLFTDDDIEIQLTKVAEQMNEHGGNIWTAILSLRREDAERLDFNNGTRWRDMLRSQTMTVAKNFKIPMENLQWYAAFHNEGHHPHVHVVIYSSVTNEGYLTKQGIANLRSSVAGEIFAQDLQTAAEKQTEHRNELKVTSRNVLTDIIARINTGGYDNPKMEELLTEIAGQLRRTKGKKVYGYLPRKTKDLIDAAVEELAKDERIEMLYALWYEQKENILKTYTETMPKRIPLSQNKEFKSVRNMVLQEALNLTADQVALLSDETEPEPPEIPDNDDNLTPDEPDTLPTQEAPPFDIPVKKSKAERNNWWSAEYKQARLALYGTQNTLPDFEKAYLLMTQEAKAGNGYAMHDVGKILLQGIGRDEDEAMAQKWFAKAHAAFLSAEKTAKKKDYLQYRIGKLYSFGYGVEQDYAQAAAWLEKAVADDNPYAAYSLGSLYHRGQGVEQDDVKAFSLFQIAAEHTQKPNAYAMYELGKMYKQGIGTEPDQDLSEQWYAAAYRSFVAIENNQADDKLQNRLGQMSMHGVGTEVNLQTAFFYFSKSVKLKNTNAEYGLGKLHLNRKFERYNVRQAVKHLTTAAQADHDAALYTLGKLFLQGKEIPKDISQGMHWLEKSADKNNSYAQYLLGRTLLRGEDVVQNPIRAEELLKASITQGNPFAAYTLGKAYLDGIVLQQNISEAVKLLTLAAEQDMDTAQYTLGKLYVQGEVVPKDIISAMDWFTRAALNGNQYAQYRLGKMYLSDEDIPKNIPASLLWLSKSAEQNNPYAQYQLGRLYLYGKDVERDPEKAVALLMASAAQGNSFAAQLLNTYRQGKNWTTAFRALRLLQFTAKAIQGQLRGDSDGFPDTADRKLRRKTNEKQLLHGIRG